MLTLAEVSGHDGDGVARCGPLNSGAPGKPPRKRFFATLDGIRGVAAAVVTFGHAEDYFRVGIGTEGYLAVDMFFLLSGVVIANAYERRLQTGLSLAGFSKIRLIRLYPLYIFGSGISLLTVLLGFWWHKEVGNLPAGLLLALMMLPNPFTLALFPFNPPAWSLFCELFANIVYAIFWRVLTTSVLAAIIAFCGFGLIEVLWSGPEHSLNIGWSLDTIHGGLFRVGFSFFAGVLLHRLFASKSHGQIHDRPLAAVPWIILCLVAVVLSAAPPPAALQPYYDFAAVVFLFPALIYCALWAEPGKTGTKICKFAGSLSYALYAVHMPLFWLFGFLLTTYTGLVGENWTPWAGFCFIGILLPLCWALDKYYDGPLRRFLTTRWPSSTF
jgi:peptidoglycan/LPS O-acetylase OafA/YrhL